jgi:hypothetical protein
MNTPQQPPAPDPYKTAIAQGAANLDTAQAQQVLNNTNQITPYGSITYDDQTGAGRFVPTLGGGQQWIPQTVATTKLSPGMQTLFDQSLSNSQQSANTAGALGRNVQDTLSHNVDLGPSATEAYLNRLNTQTLDPQWQHAQDALNQQLTNQGLTPGSEGWKYNQTQFGLNKANAYNNMYLQGHNTATQDIMAQYNEPLNALGALKSNSQVYQPGVGQTAPGAQVAVAPPNYEGMVQSNYNNATQQYGAQTAANAQMMGGLFGLGGDILKGGFGLFGSDRRDKVDIEKLGTDPVSNLPIYSFRYKIDPKTYPKVVGIMAQDAEEQYPGTTTEFGGHMVIDMAALAAAVRSVRAQG